MIITALIAEYNPFHNGHAYHIQEARRQTGADFLLVLMSGDFVQRGEPAIIDKFTRAEMAVRCGADLVLELPVCYACGSAEYFAGGAVALLNALGCVDYLCFGSECGDLEILQKAAGIFSSEPDAYRQTLRRLLNEGYSFPLARQEALIFYLAQTTSAPAPEAVKNLLSSPNNILAIEYIKALLHTQSQIKPLTILRKGSGYHDTACGEFCSATALRKAYANTAVFPTQTAASVPGPVCNLLTESWQHIFPVLENDFSAMLHYRLLTAPNWQDYAKCFDVPETLARRIFKLRYEFTDISSFVQLSKTRNLTETSVRRALLHILLKLPPIEKSSGFPVFYARILGLQKSSGALFAYIKNCGHLPLLSKLADARRVISQFYSDTNTHVQPALHMLSLDIRSAEIYGAACTAKFKVPAVSEYTKQTFVMDSNS